MTALIQVYSLQNEIGYQHADPIFVRLYQCFEVAKNPVRETLLVAVGAMGKSVIPFFLRDQIVYIIRTRTNNTGILRHVLCLLIAQLGRQNPVIRGSACMHVSGHFNT